MAQDPPHRAAAKAAGDFVGGVGEGAVDGVMGVIKGVAMLAILAGRGTRRAAAFRPDPSKAGNQLAGAAQATADFAQKTVTNPVKTASQVTSSAARGVSKVVRAGSNAVQTATSRYREAAARGERSKYVGRAVGEGLVQVGSMFIPGAAEAESVIAVAEAGKMASVLSQTTDTKLAVLEKPEKG